MIKIFTWLRANGASIIGAVQAVLKALKELLTAIVNLISLIMPAAAAQGMINGIRAVINVIDAGLEAIKKWLLRISA